ncbi:Hef nuclease [Halogeometricum borinquense DSM 11551]|uniref:ERCC4-like helicase n=1 Tax=Halogeometricum borinquense (strain ATCC 700274 / DSM 11551 / JCM 10706 / KCTC 4070 / PR3) TaxID=469382 RepID=E4NSU8_HALBP|nr:DEAD/DEAH box helicase [Halogeometricum borinquense]ADQ65836.1 ERCC4-like helicase [Halogeometricum borinquense DSM 11551]ELY26838.1 Hef nuclease [Halogeometricum borinquense DSM 11551]
MAAADDPAHVDHPLLSPSFIERRLYQIRLASAARDAHTLVCLPTGLGKTTVSLLVTAERLHEVGGKALFLAPTKPLVQQHADFYREALEIPDDEIVVFTGDVRPDDRAALWDDARIVIATPQVVENDLIGNRISLREVTHLTFDECHRGTGDYAYVYIAERYHADAERPLVTGMSASPGGDKESILEVCENLGLVEVEVMTEEDADVDEYTYDTDVEWERIQLPDEILAIRDAVNEVIKDRLEKLKSLGVTNTTSPDVSQKQLNGMRAELQKLMNNDQSEGYKGMSTHAEVMKLRRAVELVETQSVESVRRYFERQRNAARSSGASKASQRLVAEPKVREAMRKAESFDGLHPKFSQTRILLAQTLGIQDGERVIVFTESRDTAEALTDFLSESFDARRFVGQGDKEGSDGMTQKEQQETLDEFRNGEFEVLVSTSVAEEGLDVPEVDLVLFFEPVPTAIRSIQRKGRTGRQAEGRVIVLMAENTRDEAYFWISRRREKEMKSELRDLKGVADEVEEELDDSQKGLDAFSGGDSAGTDDGESSGAIANGGTAAATTETPDASTAEADSGTDGGTASGTDATDTNSNDDQAGLDSFSASDEEIARADEESEAAVEDGDGTVATAGRDDEVVEIVVDQRELDSNIAKDLSTRDGIETRLETLAVGDYVLSDRVAVERKSVSDFLDTLTGGDRSLFEQIGDLSRAYARPILILEGEGLFEERNIHPGAIRGALASLAVDFDVSVLQTRDEDDTAELLLTIATREQTERERSVSVHGGKSTKTLSEQQEYVVSAIADIGPVTARSLLEEFGTVEAVMTAREEDLLEVSGIGSVTAERIRDVIGSEYE